MEGERFLVVGATGSGKTVTAKWLLAQLRERDSHEREVIFDPSRGAPAGLWRPRGRTEVRDPAGSVVWQAPEPEGERAVSAATAYLVSDILEGNTRPSVNPIWAEKLQLRNGPRGEHRPAAVKTGTANDARDLSTYGYLAPPKKDDAPAWAVGVWIGNSDHSTPRTRNPATSLTGAAPMWRSYLRRLTRNDPVADFQRPKGVVQARIDAWSGGAPGPWTRSVPGSPRPHPRPRPLYSVSNIETE